MPIVRMDEKGRIQLSRTCEINGNLSPDRLS